MLTSVIEDQRFFPLSPGEKRLWFLHQFQSDKSVYNIVSAYRIYGKANVLALEKSLHQILNRHANLRKQFIEVNGLVTSRFASPDLFSLQRNVLDGSDVDKEESLLNALRQEALYDFDLSNGLPFRASLLELSAEESVLVLGLHHIISDGWSQSILLNDLERYYSANVSGNEIQLPLLQAEYDRYPTAQNEQLAGEDYLRQLNYWKTHLAGKVERIKLPYAPAAAGFDSFSGALEEEVIPPVLLRHLEEISRAGGVTLFMTFLAAFHTLLYKYSGSLHIVTGVPMANRSEETKELIGFFANTLILATDFTDDKKLFTELLADVRNTVLDAHEHQALPFEILAAEQRKETGIDANELLQVMFAFQSNPDRPLRFDGLKTEVVGMETTTAKFDLTLFVTPTDNCFKISIEYKLALFTKSTIRRMIECFMELLYSIVKDPAQRVTDLDWISAHGKAWVTKKWNATEKMIPPLCVHEIFELQVEDTPNQIAIDYEGNSYTYREVNSRANQMAARLLALGTQKEEGVGVLMDESHEAIISELAILKAGAAYIPLDPTYPKERLIHMLRTSGAGKVITSNKYADYLEGDSFLIIDIEKEAELISAGKEDNPKVDVSPQNLSNIMFTSGSTGKPKGVALEHRGIVRLLVNVDYLNLNSKSRILKTGAFSFDASTLEVWGALLTGGRLYLCQRENLLDHVFLKQKIIREGITTLWITSSWFSQLAAIDPTMFSSVSLLLVGGDKLSTQHINKVIEVSPRSLTIYNAYGPTENSVFSTVFKIEGKQTDPISIGKPIPNSLAYVLDGNRHVVPVGVAGEIYVGGLGVARGYINNPELTAEKFLPDPFHPGGEMYKTGDMGRWLEDGTLEFMGRKDNQIKLRGFRIEPGEIEHVLTRHPLVKDVVVLAHGTNDDNKRLIAFYVSDGNVTTAEIRNFLRESLPEHMVPSQFVDVERFPLTANGKVDRAALLEEIDQGPVHPLKFERPANPLEEKLLGMWEEVLARGSISVTDSFFHLGGHSLLATRLMSKIKKAFNEDFPVSLLFKAPSVRELAEVISKKVELVNPAQRGSSLVPVQPRGSQPPLFVIPGYLFYFNLSKYLGNDQPLYGFEPIGGLSVQQVASAYIKELKQIQPDGPYYIGGYCAGGIVAFEIAQQLMARGEQIGLLALFEVYTPEGVVSKASPKYLRDRLTYLTVNFRAASFNGKLKIVSKECKKLFQAFTGVFARDPDDKYFIKPYPGPIKLFKAMDGMVGSADDAYMGWGRYCAKENLEVINVPGNHDTMFKEPHVPILSRYVEALLVQSREEMTKDGYVLSA